MGRVIGIVTALVVLLGGIGYYFVGVLMPARRLRFAREEIERWETRWIAANECVLGSSPASSKTREALAVREMLPDPWDRGSCTKLIAKLSRGEGPESGIPDVERAWGDVDAAVSKAAQAFAVHIDPDSAKPKVDPLPDALDALDAARTALRSAASLSTVGVAGPSLPAAQVVPIRDGTEGLIKLDSAAIPSAHGMTAIGQTKTRIVQVTLHAGAAPVVARVGQSAVRGVPDPGWGAAATADGARAGAMDVEGVITTPAVPDPLGEAALAKDAGVGAALGTLASGVVLSGDHDHISIAHRDGDHVISVVHHVALETFGTDADGRGAIVWYDNHAAHAQIIRPGMVDRGGIAAPADDDIVDLGTLSPTAPPCLTADRAWVNTFDTEQLVGFGGGKPLVQEPTEARLIGCAPDGAIARSGGDVFVCTATCRHAQPPTGAPSFTPMTLVAGKLVAISVHGGVVGVWYESGAHAFYALPAAPRVDSITTAMTDGKVIDVVGLAIDGDYSIVRVPITAK